jgi:hypothetical protein
MAKIKANQKHLDKIPQVSSEKTIVERVNLPK